MAVRTRGGEFEAFSTTHDRGFDEFLRRLESRVATLEKGTKAATPTTVVTAPSAPPASVSIVATAPLSSSPSPITGAGTLTHNTSGVSAGTYTNATVTVDAYGHITSVSSGAGFVPTTRAINTTLPLTGGGNLSADLTLAINTFTGDSGSGGATGVVPAPAAGDAAAQKFLAADGTWKVGSVIVGNNQTGTTYTFVLTDAGKVVEGNNAASITFTIPPVSSVAWPVGTIIEVFQQGAGQITIAGGTGVTLRSRGSLVKTAGQYGTIALRMRANDEWVLSGDLA